MNNILPIINMSKGKKDDNVIDLRHKKVIRDRDSMQEKEVVYDEYGPIHENSEARTKAWCEEEDTVNKAYADSIVK